MKYFCVIYDIILSLEVQNILHVNFERDKSPDNVMSVQNDRPMDYNHDKSIAFSAKRRQLGYRFVDISSITLNNQETPLQATVIGSC